jgi:hypothetical protein
MPALHLILTMLLKTAGTVSSPEPADHPEEPEGGDEVVVLVDEEEEGEGEHGEPDALGGGSALVCPACDAARFYVMLELTSGVDVRHETPGEDVNEALLRIETGFVWKKAGGWFAAKADARLDFLVSGKKDPDQDDYVLSRSEVRFEPREWFVEFITRPVDFRIGSQLLRFSRCDIFSPADFLAPYDLTEPYRGEWSFPRLPVLALRSDWKPSSDLFITFVLVPFYTPPRYDLFGTDQAVLGPSAPDEILQTLSLFESLVDPSMADRVRGAMVASKLPEEWGPNQSLALRFEKTAGALDAGLTYLFTFGPIPELSIHPDFAAAVFLFLGGAPDLAGEILSDLIARGEDFVTTRYRRMHVLSIDASAEAGPVVLSGEAGWIPEMWLTGIDAQGPLPSLTNVKTGLMTASLQVQYSRGEMLAVAVEAAYAQMLDPAAAGGGVGVPPVMFFGDERRQLSLGLAWRLALLRGKLEWSFTGQAGVLDRSMILSTRLSYELWDRFKPFVGAVFYEVFGGRPSPDLSIAASRDFNDEIFFGFIIR